MDLAFDTEGNLYALQYANQSLWKGNLDGSVIKIANDETRTTILSSNGLESPTALTIGADGDIYVTTRGDRPGVGQVLKIENPKSVPESTSTFSLLAFLGTVSITLLHKGKAKRLF
ncbi:ScyD/ScyE family protein [uncultured Nostoc sp.]|uniref:ScyD/ScyE family protein n=1 Tax=uncultured Nostoc sp. TaxID=340711 RepID=UPI0035CA685A